VPEKTETKRITVRMADFILAAARERASLVGIAPSRWIAALVQANVTRLPVCTDNELRALEASARELAAIGRNINQIARALNEAHFQTERVRLDRLEMLAEAIRANREAIRLLVRASRNVWRAD
jgi:hypothetical protein